MRLYWMLNFTHWSIGISWEDQTVGRKRYYIRCFESANFTMYCLGVYRLHLWITFRFRGYGWNG